MTNHEKYKQAFSAIHAKDQFSLEVNQMEKRMKRYRLQRMVTVAAACMVLVGSAAVAYAADLGGIQRTVQLWIHGEQTEATITFDGNGSYSMDYTDAAGNVQHQSGGGIAFAPDGTEVPVSEKDLMEELTAPDVRYEDDGTVWVYWFGQKTEITNRFENDICYVKLVNGKKPLYMTVKYQGSYATSPHRYPTASEFN